jgi:two-component system chemotaxis response regulator CheB
MKNQISSWIGINSKESVEIKISDHAVFLFLSDDSEKQTRSVGTLLQAQKIIYILKNRAELRLWLNEAFVITEQTCFRLLGSEALFADLASALVELGLKAGKHVTLPPDSILQFIPSESRLRVQKSLPAALASSAKRKIRVLVVDDSKTIRSLLSRIFTEDPELECVGTVELPSQVAQAIESLKPDVLTLDIHMPEMDGVTLLKQLMPKYRLPTVMISSLSKEEGSFVLDALESGAVDYIQK